MQSGSDGEEHVTYSRRWHSFYPRLAARQPCGLCVNAPQTSVFDTAAPNRSSISLFQRAGTPVAAVSGTVIEAIEKFARTGKIGDGKIFVMDLGQAFRVRTGETGEAAL